MQRRWICFWLVVMGSCCTSVALAQSLWGVDGVAARVENVTGPPMGPCGYPSGPLIGGTGSHLAHGWHARRGGGTSPGGGA